MNDLLKGFFSEERKRVFIPDPDFARRVFARAGDPAKREFGIWENAGSFARPVVALGLLLLLALVAVEGFFPMAPELGLVDAYLEADEQPSDRWLYREAELPSGSELLVEIFLLEEHQ